MGVLSFNNMDNDSLLNFKDDVLVLLADNEITWVVGYCSSENTCITNEDPTIFKLAF